MDLITDPTAVASAPAPPTLTGTRGYFTGGTPGVTAATRVRYWYLNLIVQELMNILSAAGVTPSPTNNGQILQSLQALFAPITTASGFSRRQNITSSGTWTVPAGVYQIEIDLVGGGGGSGGCAANQGGAGGSAGGFASKTPIAVTPGQVLTCVVGAGGSAGASGGTGTGGAGGASYVTLSGTTICSATGGNGGAGGNNYGSVAAGTPGIGTVGDLLLPGGYGQDGQQVSSSTLNFAGAGGVSAFGGGGRGSEGGGSSAAGQAPGSGAGGSYAGAAAGNVGAAGIIIVRY